MSDLNTFLPLFPAGDGPAPETTTRSIEVLHNQLEFMLTSSNVRGWPYMTQTQVEHDVKAISKYGQLGAVHFGQEAWLARYNAAWGPIMKAAGFGAYNLGPSEPPDKRYDRTANPIFMNPEYWNVITAYVRELHEANLPISPIRTASIVQSERNGYRCAFVNMHKVSHQHTSAWARQKAVEYDEKVTTILHNLYGEGFNLFYGGDLNTAETHKYMPNQQTLITHVPDHLYAAMQPGIHCHVENTIEKAPGNTDHLTIGARVMVTKS